MSQRQRGGRTPRSLAAEQLGMLLGVAAAAVVLTVVAALLVFSEGGSAAALIAVWLWMLPALGLGAGFGWLVGRAVAMAGRRRTGAA